MPFGVYSGVNIPQELAASSCRVEHWKLWQYFPSKHWCLSTRLHCVTSQNRKLDVFLSKGASTFTTLYINSIHFKNLDTVNLFRIMYFDEYLRLLPTTPYILYFLPIFGGFDFNLKLYLADEWILCYTIF
jgi:hypothetical protein